MRKSKNIEGEKKKEKNNTKKSLESFYTRDKTYELMISRNDWGMGLRRGNVERAENDWF